MKYKLKASTHHMFCPKLKKLVPDSQVPDNVNSVYEIVINGLNSNVVEKAMAKGIKAAVKIPEVVKISAGNFGGKIGPFRAYLKEVLQLQ
jgi:formylmethanofuran--tetrahydromethanopterin N-formyltransferase